MNRYCFQHSLISLLEADFYYSLVAASEQENTQHDVTNPES